MSKDYECLLNHTIKDGETTISVRVREGPPYKRGNAVTIKRAKRADVAGMRALKSFLALD